VAEEPLWTAEVEAADGLVPESIKKKDFSILYLMGMVHFKLTARGIRAPGSYRWPSRRLRPI
jgi:hypothetical protein